MTEPELRIDATEWPDWWPRPWTAEELEARRVPAKITDPEERKRVLRHVTTGLRTTARFADIADELSRGWPEPLDL